MRWRETLAFQRLAGEDVREHVGVGIDRVCRVLRPRRDSCLPEKMAPGANKFQDICLLTFSQ